MYAKEVNEHSPLRILEKSIKGGLGKGNLGVVMARAGVGKTACLVQIGLDDLMRGRGVFHVALGQSLEHVQSWYDALFDDLAEYSKLEDKEGARTDVVKHRVIKAFADQHLPPERLERAIDMFVQHVGFKPSVLLIDGYDWSGGHSFRDAHTSHIPVAAVSKELQAFKALAKKMDCELWISAQTHRGQTGEHPDKLTPPCAPYAQLIDVAIFLESQGNTVQLRLLRDHGEASPAAEIQLKLHADTMRLVAEADAGRAVRLPAVAYTLLSGAAAGAEAEFGACAEGHNVAEINFSFAGRATERVRGLVNLSENDLKQGDVSSAYLTAHMHRSYPETPLFRKVLQSIWHQVSSTGEVFAVGAIQPDNTVKGGTGWACELARHWDKPVHVFDQERHGWYSWKHNEWVPAPDVVITKTRFTGTGTRFLTDEGKAAIRSLFERSFGKPA
jgi:hypothetical protein